MKLLRYTAMLLLLSLTIFRPCVSVSQELLECYMVSDDTTRLIGESHIPVEDIFDVALNNQYVAVIYKLSSSEYIYAVYEINGCFSYAYQTPHIISGTKRFVDSEGNVIVIETRSNPHVAYKLFNPARNSMGVFRFYPDRSFIDDLVVLNLNNRSSSVLGTSYDKLIVRDAVGKTIIVFDHSEEYKDKFGRLGSVIKTYHMPFTLVGILAAVVLVVLYSALMKRKRQT